MNNQKEIFLKSEGNSWFDRNQKVITDDCPTVTVIKNYTNNFKGNILEIGCSNGKKLNEFRGNGIGYGIDPSEKAIDEGRKNHKDLHLSVGTSDSLPYEDNFFDIVVFGFCLYLVDRTLLLKTISEADRVLKDKGFLVITDFDSPINLKRKYHHLDGIFSYKQQYENLFLTNSMYTLVEKKSYSHFGLDFHQDPNERVSTVVLHKDIDSAYVMS